MDDEPALTRREPRECIAPDGPACRMTPVIESHSASLNDAHGRLREHASILAALQSTATHLVERVTRGEGHASEQHRLLVSLQGSVEAVRTEQSMTARAIESLTRVSQSTHETLMEHVEHSRIRDEELSAMRVKNHESATMRAVKIIGILSGSFLILAAMHGVMTGAPLWPVLLGILKGG
jgi:hypothetical protein